uniref:Replication helicase subunit n=1 Tax=Ptilothamnion sphaericum TaxID=1498216 RepID=A0A4D6WZ67_9FLOR|nr:replication helicase subunit [Ptilothamnion sphaericum]
MILYKEDIQKHDQTKYNNIDIMICKNRNGPTGSCQLYFSPESTKFYNIHDIKIDQLT